MYLLDTNVVSELRRAKPHGAVLAWLESVRAARLCVSAITVGELQSGVERVRVNDPDKAGQIEAWLDAAILAFEVLPVDAEIIRLWARLKRGRKDDHFEDASLAATAMVHGLTLVTRNVRDFAGFDLAIVNPFV
jgi:predicted nucleic acid-binding protein